MKIPTYRLSLVRESDVEYDERFTCRTPSAAARLIWDVLKDEPNEVMGCLMLDKRQRVMGLNITFRGTQDRMAVDPRPFLQAALLSNSAGILIFHNHPSGDPSPSVEDIAFTKRLREAGECVGATLVDHIIVGSHHKYHSMKERGNLN